ncbi:MAG: DNA-directed RNA polymerase subunit P [Candidatus Nanoarchaeia archaeon]|nr:DNA-directed RNA polymerase subunit P [Candidatus Nanoarchaeia archaeon]
MVKYVCKHCKFRCESKILIECPYCGRDSLEKEKSAEELLNDINDILND